MRSICGCSRNAARTRSCFDGEQIGALPAGRHRAARHRHGARGTQAVSLAQRRGEPPRRRLGRAGAGTLDPRHRSTTCSRSCRERRASPGTRSVRRPAADGGDRPRADVQPARCCCATRSALALRRSSSRTSTPRFPRIREAGAAIVVVEQDIGQALAVADRVYCMMEGRVTLVAGRAHARRSTPLFRSGGMTLRVQRLPPISPTHDRWSTAVIWLDTIVQGVLLGGLYALFAAGLSLVFGVMRLVNLAHGDLIVLRRLSGPGWRHAARPDRPGSPRCLPTPLMFALGWLLQSLVLNRVLGQGHPAAAARHLRPLDHPAERPARGLLRRQPPHPGRRAGAARRCVSGRSRSASCRC